MLINCPSCKVKFLINSADLRSDGRNVMCANCKYQWFQKPDFNYKHKIESYKTKISKDSTGFNKLLPSTYVEVQETSLMNSLLMIIFVFFIFVMYFIIKNLDQGMIYLITYYIQELISYTNQIINDLARVFHKIVNQ